jgi:hypothetical protein
MKAHQLLPVALAAFATAQDNGDTPSLAEALASQNDTLSALNGKVMSMCYPSLKTNNGQVFSRPSPTSLTP